MTPEEMTALWQGEPPPLDEAGDRQIYDLNKELLDDLCGGVPVKSGRRVIKSGFWRQCEGICGV